MKNVCIVGFGAIGRIHAKALSEVNNANLYAVCDIKDEKISEAKQLYENIVSYRDFDEMLCDENISGIQICTPHFLHYEMIKKALEKGKTVVCEKPLVMTREEMDKLLTLKNADKVAVTFQNRLNACVKKAKEVVESGAYGKIIAAKCQITWKRTKEYYSDDWHGKWATEGGGVLINQAIHTFDYFNFVMGGIESLKANMTNFALDIEVEDTFTARLKLKCGAEALFFATNVYGTSTKPEVEIIFENGVLLLKDDKLCLNGEIIAENSKEFLGKDYWGIGHIGLLKNFYEENRFYSPFDVRETMYGIFAMYESAKDNGKEIVLGGNDK